MKTIPFHQLDNLKGAVCFLREITPAAQSINGLDRFCVDVMHSHDNEFSRISLSNGEIVLFDNTKQATNFLSAFGLTLRPLQ